MSKPFFRYSLSRLLNVWNGKRALILKVALLFSVIGFIVGFYNQPRWSGVAHLNLPEMSGKKLITPEKIILIFRNYFKDKYPNIKVIYKPENLLEISAFDKSYDAAKQDILNAIKLFDSLTHPAYMQNKQLLQSKIEILETELKNLEKENLNGTNNIIFYEKKNNLTYELIETKIVLMNLRDTELILEPKIRAMNLYINSIIFSVLFFIGSFFSSLVLLIFIDKRSGKIKNTTV